MAGLWQLFIASLSPQTRNSGWQIRLLSSLLFTNSIDEALPFLFFNVSFAICTTNLHCMKFKPKPDFHTYARWYSRDISDTYASIIFAWHSLEISQKETVITRFLQTDLRGMLLAKEIAAQTTNTAPTGCRAIRAETQAISISLHNRQCAFIKSVLQAFWKHLTKAKTIKRRRLLIQNKVYLVWKLS